MRPPYENSFYMIHFSNEKKKKNKLFDSQLNLENRFIEVK